jgi:hypothetical protein
MIVYSMNIRSKTFRRCLVATLACGADLLDTETARGTLKVALAHLPANYRKYQARRF